MPVHRYKVPGDSEPWVIDARYQLIKRIGKGSYGIVCSAYDTVAKKKVAIKKIMNIFDPSREDDLIPRRIHRELKIMKHFNHENILTILDALPVQNPTTFESVYIVMDCLDFDLRRIIKYASEGKTQLAEFHVKYIMYQVLRGLKTLHSANVMHRDLSPSNVLINCKHCEVKICDLGLARGFDEGEEFQYAYVQARHYRAPEVSLQFNKYGKAVDVWSAGCILAEFFLKRPLFSGKDYKDQLHQTLKIVGTPPQDYLRALASDAARRYVNSLPHYEKRPLSTVFPHVNRAAIDLLERMLTFHPDERITAEDALNHEWLADAKKELEDPSKPDAAPVFDYSFERQRLTRADYRARIYEEVSTFRHGQDLDLSELGPERQVPGESIEITDFTPDWVNTLPTSPSEEEESQQDMDEEF